MVKIRSYNRTQTVPENGGIYSFACADCEKISMIFCLESQQKDNKYLKSGICPACFEIAVEAKVRG